MSISARRWPRLCDEAVAEDGEIRGVGGAGVGLERGIRREAGREICGVAPRRIMMQAMSRRTRLMGEALFEGGLAGGAELGEVAVEQSGRARRRRDLLGGAGELLEDVLQAAAVVGEEQSVGHGEGFAGGLRGDEGIAVAVAADPGAEATSWGRCSCEIRALQQAVLGGEGAGDLGVEDGEGVEEAGLVVVERHADLVADGGAGAADVVGLPEGGDLGDEVVLEGFELRFGDGDAVELFEEVGDAAALEHDAAAGDLGGVRGEDGGDADAAEKCEGFVGGGAGLAQAAEGSAQIAALTDCRTRRSR